MGTSKAIVPVANLGYALEFLKANGFKITEALPYDKPNANAHKDDSFHYDESKFKGKLHSHAADINWANQSQEPAQLRWAVVKLQHFGLSVIYARDGIYDAAAFHRTHVHTDIGANTNLGRRWTKTVPKNLVVLNTQLICHVPTKIRYNVDNADLIKRLKAIREASKHGGTDFPYGVKYLQAVLGVRQTGKWDSATREAHDEAVKALETLWKKDKLFVGTPNTIWTSATDSALASFHRKY